MELRLALVLAEFLEGDSALALSRNALSIFSMSDLRGGRLSRGFGIAEVIFILIVQSL